jgi:hypothetical protein
MSDEAPAGTWGSMHAGSTRSAVVIMRHVSARAPREKSANKATAGEQSEKKSNTSLNH